MIWNANHVLDNALSAESNGVPFGLVENCKAVVLLCVEEVGVVLSGNFGTGLIMKHLEGGGWSNPSALTMRGMGLGIHAGAATKDIIVLIFDEKIVEKFGEAPLQMPKFAGQSAVTEGKVSRSDKMDTFKEKDEGAWAFLMTTGVFGGISMEGATVKCNSKANGKFYDTDKITAKAIFDGEVTAPEGSGIDTLHSKLELMRQGKTATLSVEELKEKEAARQAADAAVA